MKTLDWISVCFSDRVPDVSKVRPFLLYLDGILHHRGPKALIISIKAIRMQYMNYLSDNSDTVKGIGVTMDGIPVSLGDLIPEIRKAKVRVPSQGEENKGSHTAYAVHQLLITIFLSTRSLNIGRVPDIDPIIRPLERVVPDISEYVRDF